MAWKFKLLHGPLGGVTEGPAWDGKTLLYTQIPASRIYRYSPDTGVNTVYRGGTECANGLMFDANGNLYACEGDARRVVRYCLLYTSPSPRDATLSRMPSSA